MVIKNEEEKNFSTEVIDFFKDLVVIVVVVKLVTIFLVSVFIINGQSMYGSYYDKEFILVDRFSTLEIGKYKDQDVIRGDVVVFKPGVDEVKEFFIKRVIGMPGDSVKIEGGQVYLKKSGEDSFIKLNETYLNKENAGNTISKNKKDVYKVPKGKYFVMGDNRNHSSDSRSCFSYSCSATSRDNFITKKHVVGKVLIDFGYFNFKNFTFTHPNVTKNGKPIGTKPKWMNSLDSYNY